MATPPLILSDTSCRIDAVAEWRGRLTGLTGGVLLFEALTGLAILLMRFGALSQVGVLLHTLVGVAAVAPVAGYATRHWRARRGGNLSHYQLLGYAAVAVLVICAVSGGVLTWQAAAGPRIDYGWDQIHLATGLAVAVLLVAHLATVASRRVAGTQPVELLARARRRFYWQTAAGTVLLAAVWGGWAMVAEGPALTRAFPSDYAWRFGADRPFAPSLARLDYTAWQGQVQDQIGHRLSPADREQYRARFAEQQGSGRGLFTQVNAALAGMPLAGESQAALAAIFAAAAQALKDTGSVDPRALAGSAGCGSAGCHEEIYREWLPSAHRYSSLDDLFQRVQAVMAVETSPETTRYCAGCHDPISLFSGAKNAGNITLSAEGASEGSSCVVCHSMVQTDVAGNGDYTLRIPRRYLYELDGGRLAKVASDFLIRAYPDHHLRSFSRALYKRPEMCAACHKQYIDKEVNIDIGKVQGQNQYDSWKNSRWYHGDDSPRTITCRECHMPLAESRDPARGDASDYNRTPADGKHRSHGMAAGNQYIPVSQGLEGGAEHARLVERWLRGEIEIPEIADKWTRGPVIRMEVVAPEQVAPGQEVRLQVALTNNKTGHDFPTGPLDMIESWVELSVVDRAGQLVYHQGGLDEAGRVADPVVILKAAGFDREARLIDRHNLWDMVGASYKRSLYPGMTDAVETQFQCPSMARGRVAVGDGASHGGRTEAFAFPAPAEGAGDRLTVTATLWYRKANPDFLNTVYGVDSGVRAPVTSITESTITIDVVEDLVSSAQ